MKITLVSTVTASLLLAFGIASARDFRDFTDVQGRTIRNAELLDMQEGMVKIRTQGRVFDIPLESLSEGDRTWLAEWDIKRKGNEETLYYSEVVFEDDFSGAEFGEKWGHYKSSSLIEDGVMVGKTIDIKDHAGCDSVRFEGRQDMEVAVKFRFASEEAERFNVWFDDKDFKGAHAGHVCNVTVSPTSVAITDAKTGNMENSIYEKKKSPEGLDAETTEMLKSKTARFEIDIEKDKAEWHDLLIRTKGDTITVMIDGDEVGEFSSEGNAHETKSLVSLTTYENDVQYDDFVVKAAPLGDGGGEAEDK